MTTFELIRELSKYKADTEVFIEPEINVYLEPEEQERGKMNFKDSMDIDKVEYDHGWHCLFLTGKYEN